MNDDTEMRLARVDLGEGWIDLGYGEPVVIQEIFRKYMKSSYFPNKNSFMHSQYQPAQGNKELVNFLENKYQAKVVVTNGAKQGIAAVMYALKKLNHKSCMIHAPYWVSTPTIINDSGLETQVLNGGGNEDANAFMLTSPNNPDGRELSKEKLLEVSEDARNDGVVFIHDAAYYTPIYSNQELTKVGDVQIYSFSKMYGLSGIRVGYVVVHNEKLLPSIAEFVERTCSGVSTASQSVALAVETFFKENPDKLLSFEKECRDALMTSRKELQNLDSEVLTVEPCESNSMFAWCKVGPKLDAKTSKVNILDGELFGKPGYVRLNIAVNSDLIKTAVRRLNGRESSEK